MAIRDWFDSDANALADDYYWDELTNEPKSRRYDQVSDDIQADEAAMSDWLRQVVQIDAATEAAQPQRPKRINPEWENSSFKSMATNTDLAKLAATNFGAASPAPTEGATSETTNPAPMDTSDEPTGDPKEGSSVA